MALYVSILGAVVASLFPADQAVPVNSIPSGTGEGYQLFLKFCVAQAFFIVAVLPALAAGTLAQERERGTLESFLLTPLTPAEIVWGKAAGVLCYGGLLLAATLPLTSLSFLLGGVSPADVITAYILLLALSAFVVGFGLYCSARWTNAVRATVACYFWLPIALFALVAFSGVGSIIAGATIILGALWAALRVLPRWKSSALGKRLGFIAEPLFYLGLLLAFVAIILILAGSYGLGLRMFILVFVTPYVLYVAKLGLEYTGTELARHREPAGPARERLNDLRADWQRAIEAPQPFVPAPTGRYTYTAQTAPPRAAPQPDRLAPPDTGWADIAPAAPQRPAQNAAPEAQIARTVGPKEPEKRAAKRLRPVNPPHFLPDRWNPVFTRDMRQGLLGRWTWLVRAGYGALIAGQLYFMLRLGVPYLLGEGSFSPAWQQVRNEWPGLARLHLALVLLAGAVFGARAFAPEREQQTLSQLLTTPLPNRTIIGGKLMAALAYTSYAFLVGAPLTVLMMLLFVLTPIQGLSFLGLEVLLGTFAASWGLFCSMRGLTARRALGWSAGGVSALVGSEIIASALDPSNRAAIAGLHLLPMSLVPESLNNLPATSAMETTAFAFYGLLTVLLLVVTAMDFKRYAAQV